MVLGCTAADFSLRGMLKNTNFFVLCTVNDTLLIRILQKVTAKDVRDVALKYIYDRCPAVAAVGPVENLPDYNRIRSSMYWLRL